MRNHLTYPETGSAWPSTQPSVLLTARARSRFLADRWASPPSGRGREGRFTIQVRFGHHINFQPAPRIVTLPMPNPTPHTDLLVAALILMCLLLLAAVADRNDRNRRS